MLLWYDMDYNVKMREENDNYKNLIVKLRNFYNSSSNKISMETNLSVI